MNTLEIILTGFSLAMDASLISIHKGTINRDHQKGLIMIITFSLFQTIMPIIGYYIGNEFNKKIINFSPILSSILLITIGIMIYKEEDENIPNTIKFIEIILLGITTSIDALVIGISFSFLDNSILYSSIIIGIITFICCNLAYFLGHKLNKKLSHSFNKIGGITLIIIGINTIMEYLP